jgi:hypothetical protein
MSEQSDGEPKKKRKRLDRSNLPDEFTPEFLEQLVIGDLVWLERDAELTERQRETLTAWSEKRFGGIAKALHESASRSLGGTIKVGELFKGWPKSNTVDLIGKDLRESIARLQESVKAPVGLEQRVGESFPKIAEEAKASEEHRREQTAQLMDSIRRTSPVSLHREQQESLRQMHVTFQEVAIMMSKLVERTEQQHEAAERQKTTNWALAVIAVASMAGTFAAVDSMSHFWWALIATIGVAGILYPFMHK